MKQIKYVRKAILYERPVYSPNVLIILIYKLLTLNAYLGLSHLNNLFSFRSVFVFILFSVGTYFIQQNLFYISI